MNLESLIMAGTVYLINRMITEDEFVNFIRNVLGVEDRKLSEEEAKKATEWLRMKADMNEIKQDQALGG